MMVVMMLGSRMIILGILCNITVLLTNVGLIFSLVRVGALAIVTVVLPVMWVAYDLLFGLQSDLLLALLLGRPAVALKVLFGPVLHCGGLEALLLLLGD